MSTTPLPMAAPAQQGAFSLRLGDIWKAYDSWSTYGTPVPIMLDEWIDSRIVQYYTPFLSAIQIFTTKPVLPPLPPSPSRSLVIGRSNDERGSSQNCSCSNFEHSYLTINQLGHLYFQYNETTRPFERAPLGLKVAELAEKHPGITSLKCSDLSPYSWVSVAWYPIYQIPTAKGVKELSASFLTYHALGPVFPEALLQTNKKLKLKSPISSDGTVNEGGTSIARIVLSPFGVVTYKLFGSVWIDPETSDKEKIEMHEECAASWLETLRFKQSDFAFFRCRKFNGSPFPHGR